MDAEWRLRRTLEGRDEKNYEAEKCLWEGNRGEEVGIRRLVETIICQ